MLSWGWVFLNLTHEIDKWGMGVPQTNSWHLKYKEFCSILDVLEQSASVDIHVNVSTLNECDSLFTFSLNSCFESSGPPQPFGHTVFPIVLLFILWCPILSYGLPSNSMDPLFVVSFGFGFVILLK